MPSSKTIPTLPDAHPSNTNPPGTAAPEAAAPDELTPSWRRAREFLETCKARIAGQINAYPPPIPACDTQFNTLLEQRGKLTEELNRLEAAHRESRGGGDGNHALAGFIVTSEFIDEAAERKIKEG